MDRFRIVRDSIGPQRPGQLLFLLLAVHEQAPRLKLALFSVASKRASSSQSFVNTEVKSIWTSGKLALFFQMVFCGMSLLTI
jgi:hypothetical protein